MQNKTVLITQPNARISRELLYDLARRGAYLILAYDKLNQCEEIKQRLVRKYSVKSDMIDCRRLENDSMTSVRRLAAGVLADFHRLDCVILQSPSCVKSIIAGERRLTHDGFEHELGVNYFNTYLLSRLLIDRLNESNGRLIFVNDTQASDIAEESSVRIPDTQEVTIPLENLNWENTESYTPKKGYQRSQWFLSMFADELARRNSMKGEASILVVNPRISRNSPSEVDKNDVGGLLKLFYKLSDICARLISRKAASTSLFCAIADPAVIDLTGDGVNHKEGQVVMRSPVYQDLRLLVSSKQNDDTVKHRRYACQLLWDVSEKWTRLDTHPTALPLPKQSSVNKKEVSGDNEVQSIPAVHI
ncbi:unnamed protein product [Heterobilharzia americana]|nr:unnamed protein product [Heterobilharzia americana]